MKTSKSLVIAFFVDMLLVSMLIFGGIRAVDEEPRYGGTLKMGVMSDPKDFAPTLAKTSGAGAFQCNVYSKLIRVVRGPNTALGMGFEGDLAESWELSSDGLELTFHLRENVTWSDGTPFTSADAKFTYDTHWNSEDIIGRPSAVSIRMKAASFIRCEAPDPYTYVEYYSTPHILEKVHGSGMAYDFIIPKHIWEGTDFETNPARYEPIGTGPFLLEEYVQGGYARFKANENYFRGRPYLDEFVIISFSEPEAVLLAFDAKEIDAVNAVYAPLPYTAYAKYKDAYGVNVDTWPSHAGPLLAFNFREEAVTANPWVQDKRVRQAISYAVDRGQISASVFSGLAVSSYGPVSAATTDFYNSEIEGMFPTDISKANQLLDDAGLPAGTDDIRFGADMIYMAEYSELAEVVRSQLLMIGVNLNLIPIDHTTFVTQYENGLGGLKQYPMALFTQVNTGDPTLATIYTATEYTPEGGGQNCGYYSNSTLDEAWTNAVETGVYEERKNWIFKVQEILVEDVPYIWLVQTPNLAIWRDEFAGLVTTRPDGGHWDAYGGVDTPVWWTNAPFPSTDPLEEIMEQITEMIAVTNNMMMLIYGTIIIEIITLAAVIVVVLRRGK